MAIQQRSLCPINLALEIFGDKWSLLIVRDLMFAGKRRPPEGWAAGSYEAHFTVSRDGAVVFERRFAISF